MSPERMAELHGAGFSRPWSAQTFADLCQDPATQFTETEHGFALARSVLDEAEILTIVVAPETRNQGVGARLLQDLLARLHEAGITRVFLEVAEDNVAARALYIRTGFATDGRRRGYYAGSRRTAGTTGDALLMSKTLSRHDASPMSPSSKR